jgi:hypothetical protein
MISHEHRCICVSQRKVASSSIAAAFGIPWKAEKNQDWHYANGGYYSPDWDTRPTGYLTFSFTRNPWDKFVSGWLYCPQTRGVSLRDLLRNMPTPSSDPHAYAHVARTQENVLLGPDGTVIVDMLGRFERLQEDLDLVCDALGTPRKPLPHLNRTPNRLPYQEYFRDPVDRDLFLRHFSKDVEVFEYEF